MKFKIVKGTETYKKLMALKARAAAVNKEANRLAKSLGCENFCKQQHVAWGGISAFEFKEKPAGWKIVGEKCQNLFYPKATERELCEKIGKLPTIEYDAVNEIVGFKAPQTVGSDRGLLWISVVGLEFRKDVVLIEVPQGAKYKPPKDVVEILESEFIKLKGKPKKSKS